MSNIGHQNRRVNGVLFALSLQK